MWTTCYQASFVSVYSLSLICQNVDIVIHCSGMNASDSISDPHGSLFPPLFAANLAQTPMTTRQTIYILFYSAYLCKSSNRSSG